MKQMSLAEEIDSVIPTHIDLSLPSKKTASLRKADSIVVIKTAVGEFTVSVAESVTVDNAFKLAHHLYHLVTTGSSKEEVANTRDAMYATFRSLREARSPYADHLYVKCRSDGYIKIGRSLKPEINTASSRNHKLLPPVDNAVVRLVLVVPLAGFLEDAILDALTYEGFSVQPEAKEIRLRHGPRPECAEWFSPDVTLTKIAQLIFRNDITRQWPQDIWKKGVGQGLHPSGIVSRSIRTLLDNALEVEQHSESDLDMVAQASPETQNPQHSQSVFDMVAQASKENQNPQHGQSELDMVAQASKESQNPQHSQSDLDMVAQASKCTTDAKIEGEPISQITDTQKGMRFDTK